MVDKQKFDVVVIGAGPGGYVAAIKAAQMGKKVALVERGYLGGVCLNVGCIPTKTLLASSATLKKVKEAEEFGIVIKELSVNYQKMKERKDRIVTNIRKSLEGLLKQNKITSFFGEAKFTSPTELKVQGQDNLFLTSEKIIIATGSKAVDVPAFPCDHKKIVDSSSLLEVTQIPKRFVVVGGGYIGCEFASLFRELGSEVIILEALDSIVPLLGKGVSEALTSSFAKQGISIQTSVFVEKMESLDSGVKVHLAGGKTIDADLALVAVGRKAVTDNLGLEKAGVVVDERGMIPVNDRMQTNVEGIYAIGDVTGKWMLAHVASHQGMVAAQNACGKASRIYYHAVPAVVFTTPEIATVGMTLEEAQKEGYDATCARFPFQVLGKSIAANETEGFTQIISDKKTHQILGAQVVGHEASTLIGEITLAIQNELTLECITETIHAHPTVAEAWLEAALIAEGNPIHFPPKKKA